eukprot:CAMPEP_0181255020 /NCGR_PEP_ID=MMETSP1096-20121128/48921_1 /TAXON_ID=156174 ORGANISM="Chrysochromulina ericina, Strain CCMP281" /NCGR_SAMPLE_ID=MMETSP1096 /ASSEMBLY_ACC=CAM_ASM_000453 /LENGTH=33 /DNA_ID= /DNA_START= /DNA_END= /DNA_ORIENTATION=
MSSDLASGFCFAIMFSSRCLSTRKTSLNLSSDF